MRVVLDDVAAKRASGEFARGESFGRLLQPGRHARQMPRGVHVAGEAVRRLDSVSDSVESRRQRRGEGQIRIAVGAGNPAFDLQTWPAPHDAKRGRAVVVAPG